jgi:uncharacterized protein (TIGR03435 family)
MKTWIVCASIAACSLALAQQPAAKIAFDVVSIKPSAPQPMNQIRMGRSSDPGRARFTAFSLRDYVRVAYRVKDFQVQGPEWMDSARFDVEGKFPEGATEAQVPEMLQSMLADRFKLTVHTEKKDHAVFALVASKGGAKLKPAENPTEGAPGGRGGPGRGGVMMQVDDAGAHLKAPSATLANLTEVMSRFSERPIVDMTGIEGQYDFDLVLSTEAIRGGRGPGGPAPTDAASDGPGTIHEAVQKYGLKLEPRKMAMDIVTVDHIEKTPPEN